MPIRHTLYHPDRLVIAIGSGELTLVDFVAFAKAVADAGVAHYRKIFDVIDARPGFTDAELQALAKYIREYPVPGKRGALAFVVDPDRGEFAKVFANIEIGGRPARTFRSIHDARKWIADNPPEED